MYPKDNSRLIFTLVIVAMIIVFYRYINQSKKVTASVQPPPVDRNTPGQSYTQPPTYQPPTQVTTQQPLTSYEHNQSASNLNVNVLLSSGPPYLNKPEVKELQKLLNEQGQTLSLDGLFGQGTAAALQNVVGRGSITLSELYQLLGKDVNSSSTSTKKTWGWTIVNGGYLPKIIF